MAAPTTMPLKPTAVTLGFTVFAGPVTAFAERAAAELEDRSIYVSAVQRASGESLGGLVPAAGAVPGR